MTDVDVEKYEVDAPTPGQSLTSEPGARPWENPPVMDDSLEVLDHYAGKLLQPEKSAQLMEVLESGFPVTDLVDSITLAGVMEGIHTIDNAVIVAPHLYDIIIALADSFEVEYNTGTSVGNEFNDDIAVASVLRQDTDKEKALEDYEQEQVQAYLASRPESGLMSRPVAEEEV